MITDFRINSNGELEGKVIPLAKWEKMYTKDEVVAMLTEIQLEIEKMTPTYHNPDWSITNLIPMNEVIKTIQEKLVMLEK